MPIESYPVTITPSEDVVAKVDAKGRAYLSFRAETTTARGTSSRTARVFGDPNVRRMAPRLTRGIAVAARVAFDAFDGGDGRRSQTMRVISLG